MVRSRRLPVSIASAGAFTDRMRRGRGRPIVVSHAEVDYLIRMDLGRSAVDLDPEPEALAAASR
ncbi:hypothetical protein AO398_24015 [Methylobacterium sp. GXS13]|nr:hypothetical protein AO398_24015 [Methylobacterium sp. GXS13]